jgi:membrane associated rhomboid family serine protease
MRPPQDWKRARATLAISAATAIAWAVVSMLRLDEAAALSAGFIPARVGTMPAADGIVAALATPLTATLVHGGLAHLALNLMILLFCGRAVEAIVGAREFVLLYVVGAYAAAAAQFLPDPGAQSPMIGASGAISAVIGAYSMFFGRNKVKVKDPRAALALHALWLATAWIILQLLVGYTLDSTGMRLAVAAHIGGFLAGLILARPLILLRYRNA